MQISKMPLNCVDDVAKSMLQYGISSYEATGSGNNQKLQLIIRGCPTSVGIPQVFPLGEEPYFAETVLTGTPRKSILLGKPKQVHRVCLKMLSNSNIVHIKPKMRADEVRPTLEAGKWYLSGFWMLYRNMLLTALREIEEAPRLDTPYLNRLFTSKLNQLLGKIQVVKSDIHLSMMAKMLELNYPTRDNKQDQNIQGFSFGPLIDDIVKQVYIEKAIELEADVSCTGKQYPARRVLMTKESRILSSLGLFSRFDCQARANRETLSAASNAQQFLNITASTPKVISDKLPNCFERRVKYLNVAVCDLIGVVDQEGRNTDQILATKWVKDKNLLGTIEEVVEEVPYEEGMTVKQLQEDLGDSKAVSLNIKPAGSYFNLSFSVTSVKEEDSNMGYKVVFGGDAVKGFVIPDNVVLVEKRPHEDFFRPVHLVTSAKAVNSKKAYRAVLRMLLSRLSDCKQEQISVEKNTPREEFPRVLKETREALADYGDTGYSQLYKIVGKQGHTTVLVDGALEQIQGTPQEILGGKAVVGEAAIIRVPEDEDFGNSIRSPYRNNAVRMDAFMVLGKPGMPVPEEDPGVRSLIDTASALYKAFTT